MRVFGRKTGETTISHKQIISQTLFPYLVTISYLPGNNVNYFVMAEDKEDAFNKTKLNLSNTIEHFEREHHIKTVQKLKTIVVSMENNTKITLVDSNRIHKVIEFDAPIF